MIFPQGRLDVVSLLSDMFRLTISYVLISLLTSAVLTHYEGDDCGCMHMRGVCRIIQHCPEVMRGIPFGRMPITCGFTFDGSPIVCCPMVMGAPMKPHFSMGPHFNGGPGSHSGMDTSSFKPNTQSSIISTGTKPEPFPRLKQECETKKPETNDGAVKNYQRGISQIKCNEYNVLVRGTEVECPEIKIFVVGGEKAEPKEIPFMALIGYGEKDDIEWKCGGSLISPNFVLTAAHCSDSSRSGPATIARLGELDTSKKDDDARPTDYEIEARINHPDYTPSEAYNDIALFRLKGSVQFNNYVKPVCLPEPGKVGLIFDVIGAGWGLTDFIGQASPALLKVTLDPLDINDCNGTAENNAQVPRGLDGKTMICAGKRDGGKDTCSGDSGGPLFLPPSARFLSPDCKLRVQLGITSFGKQCGLPGFPGVYTKVEAYVPWIESIVWSNDNYEPGLVWTD